MTDTQEITRLVKLQVDASQAIRESQRAQKALSSVGTGAANIANISKPAEQASRSTRLMGNVFQNVGYQFSDLIVVLEQGQAPMRAIGQQGSQIAQAFTIMGGPIGAIAGLSAIAVVGITTLISVFGKLGGGTQAATDAFKQYNEATKGVAEANARALASISDLGAEYGDLAGLVKQVRTSQAELAKTEAVQGFTDAFSGVIDVLSASYPLAGALYKQLKISKEEFKAFGKAVIDLPELPLGDQAQAASDLAAQLITAAGGLDKLEGPQRTLVTLLQEGAIEAARLNIVSQELDETYQRQLKAAQAQAEAQKVLTSALKDARPEWEAINSDASDLGMALAELAGAGKVTAAEFEDVTNIIIDMRAEARELEAAARDAGRGLVEAFEKSKADNMEFLADALQAAKTKAQILREEADMLQAALDRVDASALSAAERTILEAQVIAKRTDALLEGLPVIKENAPEPPKPVRRSRGGAGVDTSARDAAALASYTAELSRTVEVEARRAEALRESTAALEALDRQLEVEDAVRSATERYEKLAEAAGLAPAAMAEGMARVVEQTTAATELALQTEEALRGVESTAVSLGSILEDSLASSLDGFIDVIFDAEKSFAEMAESMLQDIAKVILKIQLMNALSAIGGALPGGFGGFGGGVAGARSSNPISALAGMAAPAVSGLSQFAMGGGGGGGGYGGSSQPAGTSGYNGNVHVQVINQTQAKVEVAEERSSDGGRMVRMLIRNEVQGAIGDGSLDKTFRANYGVRRAGTR